MWVIHAYLPARMVVREALTEERRLSMVSVFSFRVD
jgi:hypothetical protein